jgi:hypothetical protein
MYKNDKKIHAIAPSYIYNWENTPKSSIILDVKNDQKIHAIPKSYT